MLERCKELPLLASLLTARSKWSEEVQMTCMLVRKGEVGCKWEAVQACKLQVLYGAARGAYGARAGRVTLIVRATEGA